jgi:hypothetical protein
VRRTVLAFSLAAFPVLAVAQQPEWRSADHVAAIPRAELDSITARGRLIAEYDMAAWHATDAVMALHPPEGAIQAYLARRRSDGKWEVVFGASAPDASTFQITYQAIQSAPSDTGFTASAVSPPRVDSDYFARASRALDIARKEFGRVTRPYNAMVVQADDAGEWFVYLVPAPTIAGVFPLGADVRYRVRRDGRTITDRRRLHNAVLEFPPASKPQSGTRLVAGSHAAVLADRPEDTDVFHVLTREPRVPEYIVTRSYYFRVDVNGYIAAFDRDTTRH